MEKITFKNGVEKLFMEIEADFEEGQRILNLGEYTDKIDIECAYNERIQNDFEGIYKIKVDRYDNYNQFLVMFENVKFNEETKIKRQLGIYDLMDELFKNNFSYYEYEKKKEESYNKFKEMKKENRILNFDKPSFDEWKNNRLSNGQKLGKAMRKAGFPSELLDFYSMQVKTEREVYFTITSLPQFIAGMSYYSTGDWDGMEGKSCQCPEIGGHYAIKLAGSLHDNKLFVGLLHYDLDDIFDMDGKLQARTVLRYVSNLKGKPALISTRYYGNNETKDLMHECLKRLEEVTEVYSNEILYSYDMRIEEVANGSYELPIYEDVYINSWYTIDEYVNVECPMCDGYGKYEIWIDAIEDTHDIDCPACRGKGEIEVNVYDEINIDEYVDVEITQKVLPYYEDYVHYGDEVVVKVNENYIDKVRSKREELELIEG